MRWLRIGGAVLVRPALWLTAVSQIFRLARKGWWRRPPFMPVPDEAYMHFRLQTAYGGEPPPSGPESRDVLTYLEWCRRFPR